MSKTKNRRKETSSRKKDDTTTPAETPTTPTPTPAAGDEGAAGGDLMNWPTWFGRRWPERFLGDLDDIRVEQFRDDGDLVVRGEIPGVDPADIDVSVDGGRLTIRAERRSSSESEDGFRSEFRYGSFVRALGLPDGADEEAITASYADGILEVRVPVGEAAETARRVEVTRS